MGSPIQMSYRRAPATTQSGANHVFRLRYLPPSYLAAGSPEWDHGMDYLLYIQSLIEDEEEAGQRTAHAAAA